MLTAIAKLDVDVLNPYIIIPKKSTEDDYLCVDLGRIKVTNQLLGVDKKPIPPFETDSIKVDVENLNISVRAMNPSTKQLMSYPILHNITAELSKI